MADAGDGDVACVEDLGVADAGAKDVTAPMDADAMV